MKSKISLPTFFYAEVRLVPVRVEPIDKTIKSGNYGTVHPSITTNKNRSRPEYVDALNMSIWPLDKKLSTTEIVRSIRSMMATLDGKLYEGSLATIQDLVNYKVAFSEDFESETTTLALGEEVFGSNVACVIDENFNSDLVLIYNQAAVWKADKYSVLIVWKKMATSC